MPPLALRRVQGWVGAAGQPAGTVLLVMVQRRAAQGMYSMRGMCSMHSMACCSSGSGPCLEEAVEEVLLRKEADLRGGTAHEINGQKLLETDSAFLGCWATVVLPKLGTPQPCRTPSHGSLFKRDSAARQQEAAGGAVVRRRLVTERAALAHRTLTAEL